MATKNTKTPSKKPAVAEPLRLIEQQLEFVDKLDIGTLPKGLRGIYVLYRTAESGDPMHPYRYVVYVGMSASGIRGRLKSHLKHKADLWDACSIFVVWPNVREDEIRELEGIFRHISRFDPESQQLNSQGAYQRLARTRKVETSEANRRLVEIVEHDRADRD